ncbi:hypothetical protein CRG98_031748, partial [Punica granatum]
ESGVTNLSQKLHRNLPLRCPTRKLLSRVGVSDCLYDFLVNRVDSRPFSTNDHFYHLQGSVRSQEPLALLKTSTGKRRGEFQLEHCPVRPVFQTRSVFGVFRRTIRFDLITLGENDHHGHLEGSLGYPGPLTLLKNSIGRLRGDVRLDLCQSGLPPFQSGLLLPFGSGQAKTAQTRPTSDPTRLLKITSRQIDQFFGFFGFLHNPGRSRELVDTGYRPRWPAL